MADGPLTQDHCDCLDRVLASMPNALAVADKCIECWPEFQQFKDQLLEQQRIAATAKKNFFPNRP